MTTCITGKLLPRSIKDIIISEWNEHLEHSRVLRKSKKLSLIWGSIRISSVWRMSS